MGGQLRAVEGGALRAGQDQDRGMVSMAAPNGSAYVFARDINMIWRHGILQVPPERKVNQGRISVIAWGWVDQDVA